MPNVLFYSGWFCFYNLHFHAGTWQLQHRSASMTFKPEITGWKVALLFFTIKQLCEWHNLITLVIQIIKYCTLILFLLSPEKLTNIMLFSPVCIYFVFTYACTCEFIKIYFYQFQSVCTGCPLQDWTKPVKTAPVFLNSFTSVKLKWELQWWTLYAKTYILTSWP